jgi:hypothetical protein
MIFQLFSDSQLRDHDVDTLKNFLRPKLGGYCVAIKDIMPGNLLYRGVPWQTRPGYVHQLKAPPPERAGLQRANRAGCPTFYASLAGPGILFEIRATVGQRIAIGEWELTEPLWMHNLGYHEAALRRLGPVRARPMLESVIPNETKQNRQLRHRLSLAFTEDVGPGSEYRYKQTVAINELLFDKAEPIAFRPGGPRFDKVAGTVYPAMRLRGMADNIVLSPQFVDSSLQLRSVRYVEVIQAVEEKSHFSVQLLSLSQIIRDGTIEWADASGPVESRISNICYEDGHWVMRDGYGQTYARV